jgi:hypothetical protein
LDDGTYAVVLSRQAFRIVGLDDPLRYADIRRWGGSATWIGLNGTTEALTQLATELNDRATEGADGFNESAANKKVCRRAVASLRRQGIVARD